MNPWYLALVLYLIPILPQLVHKDARESTTGYYLSAIFWPPLMLYGTIYYMIRNRKKP